MSTIQHTRHQARSQDLVKGGGYFERVRSVQTTLTRIFIDLESVSDGLSEIWDEMSRKDWNFKGFFRPKLGDLQKKKKKKKMVFANIQGDFSPNFATSNVWGGALFVWGGLFSIFHRKSASKAQKTCDFASFTSQWGGLEPPPPPPLATLLQDIKTMVEIRVVANCIIN